jgi:hypothetical protein
MVGTRHGLNRFDPTEKTYTRYQSKSKNPALSHNSILAISG